MITYKKHHQLAAGDVARVYQKAGLKRNLDLEHLAGMIAGADFVYTAWDGEVLIGVCRGLTDYTDIIYVADLAVDQDYARQGIGRHLLAMVEELAGDTMRTALLASPVAAEYYEKVGYTKHPRGYIKLN